MRTPRRTFALSLALALCSTSALAQEVMLAISNPVNLQQYEIDPATGGQMGSMPITGAQALFGGLTRDGADLYSIDGYNDPNPDRTFRIDRATGAGTVVGSTGFNWNFRCVEIHPQTGVLYATRDSALYTVDKTTGAATLVANITGPTLDQFTSFAIDANGSAYGVDIGGTGLFQLDLGTGALTHIGDANLGNFVQDLAFDGANRLWAVLGGGGSGVYQIDLASAVGTFQFSSGAWSGIAFEGCAAPLAYCTTGTTFAGCTPSIAHGGSPSAAATSGFTLSTTNVDANRSGIFFYAASNSSFVPLQWGTGGTSYLCVESPLQRLPSMNSGGTLGCTGSFSQDWRAFMAANPTALGNPLMAGQSFDAQLWMRDPPSPKTTILSNALRFAICP